MCYVLCISLTGPSQIAANITSKQWFKGGSAGLIVVGALITGIQVDQEHLEQNIILSSFDQIIMWLFALECTLNMLTEGALWHRYFIGFHISDGKWDIRARWNCFDFSISFGALGLTFMHLGGQGSVLSTLRLLRLARVLTILTRFPELTVILAGFRDGMSTVGFIMLLLMFQFYVWAIAGIYMFGQNDPGHFGTLSVAMISLMRMATLSGWHELLYIQMYGCDVFTNGVYRMGDVDEGEGDGDCRSFMTTVRKPAKLRRD